MALLKLNDRGVSNDWEIFKEKFNILSHQENENQNYFEIPSYTYQND